MSTRFRYAHSVYIHLSGCDIDDAILKANGITEKDTPTLSLNKETETPKLDISKEIESIVNKLVEAKIAELMGN